LLQAILFCGAKIAKDDPTAVNPPTESYYAKVLAQAEINCGLKSVIFLSASSNFYLVYSTYTPPQTHSYPFLFTVKNYVGD